MAQDRSGLLRYIHTPEKSQWDDSLSCFFLRFRLVDFNIEGIQFDTDAKEARIQARITGHRVNTLSTEQAFLEEDWRYEDGRWGIDSRSEIFTKMLGECHPDSSKDTNRGFPGNGS